VSSIVADPRGVAPTDDVSVLGGLNRRLERAERNTNDPHYWIYVGNYNGDQPDAPAFENGFFNVGPPRTPLRYRFLRPYDPTTTQNAIQMQGSVAGGSPGLRIFTLKYPQWLPDGSGNWQPVLRDFDVHLTCCDDNGELVVVTIQGATGGVFYGFV
jgi:hypothetical protein